MVRKNAEQENALTADKLVQRLKEADIQLFQERSGFPLNQAQRNLEGKTHYVDDATLRAHVAKIHAVQVLDDGLILGIVESVQAGPSADDGRVFRPVFFDVFGTPVYRPSIEDSFSTLKQAQAEFWKQADTLDAVELTKEGMEAKRKMLEKALDDFDQLMKEIVV